MLSSQQIETISGIISQYDYYVVYYEYDYLDYTGYERDYMTRIFCSNEKPSFDGETYSFTSCTAYELTHNKYLTWAEVEDISFTPSAFNDIVYTNVVEGAPQLVYTVSEVRNFDWGKLAVLLLCLVFSIAVVFRVVFGGIAK